MQASSIVEKQFPKDDETKISKSRLSSVASQFPSMPSKGILILIQFIFN